MNDPAIPNISAAPDMFAAERDGTGTWGLLVLLLAGELAGGGILLAWTQFGAFEPALEGRAQARPERRSEEPLLDAVTSPPQRRRLDELPMRDLDRADRGSKR